jgi:RNA polymerase sigma-70 factor, ECF subfamily
MREWSGGSGFFPKKSEQESCGPSWPLTVIARWTMPKANLIEHEALGECELVRLARGGDRDAFRIIVQRGNQQLFRVARSVMRDDLEAEDVVQEAYACAFAAIGGFRGDASIMTWLTRITLNEARRRLRRRRPMVWLDQFGGGTRAIPLPASPEGDDPEAGAARAQIRRLIERALDDLPEELRTVIVMRDIQECSVDETAASLNLHPGTVKTRLHRARRLMRKALHEDLSSMMTGVFPFLGARCQRMTEAVLRRLLIQHIIR